MESLSADNLFPPTAYKFLPHLVCLIPTIKKTAATIQIRITGGIGKPKNLPFNECINKSNHTFKDKDELKNVFKSCLGNIDEKNVVFSCGSGVTACVLALAYSLINDKYHPCIYDGSWAEYGKI